jgi:hypothetical protein
MLGYRKRSFFRAHSLLQNLRANLEDLRVLKEFQALLLSEIIHAEESIHGLKTEAKKISRSGLSSKRTTFLESRIAGFRRSIYIWRCFGDAIAFLYLDKYALKQCFYNVENTNPKQGAGFIVGKEGLLNELAVLDEALQRGIPSLLVDLTTTIRHGDICLMVGSDPYLVEVKTSSKLNNRGKRQRRSIRALHTFFEEDKAENLRGFATIHRRSSQIPERTYESEINSCFEEAKRAGYALRQPERGLYYIVLANEKGDLGKILESLALRNPWVFPINEAKLSEAWAPYVPFTLSITNQDHLWGFIQGEFYVLVILEQGVLCEIAQENGYEAKFDLSDQLYPLRVNFPGGTELAGASIHVLARVVWNSCRPSGSSCSCLRA